MMRQNIFEHTKRQAPKMTFVFVLKRTWSGSFFLSLVESLFLLDCLGILGGK